MEAHFSEEYLWGYLAKELTPEERKEVAKHLLGCEECYERYEKVLEDYLFFEGLREKFRNELSKRPCPSEDILRKYVWLTMIPFSNKADLPNYYEISEHLFVCEKCKKKKSELISEFFDERLEELEKHPN